MRSFLLILAGVANVLGFPVASRHVVHERRDVLPEYWIEGSRLDKQERLPVRIGLAQSNLDHGHDLLMEISDPASSRYGKYLSAEEVHGLFAPAEDSIEQVRAWLESKGIDASRISHSINRQWLQFDASAEEMEWLLQAEYYLYSHTESGRSHIACREYYVPESVQSHIDYITPGVKLLELDDTESSRQKMTKRNPDDGVALFPRASDIDLEEMLKNGLPGCDVVISPDCIRKIYKIPEGKSASPGNELGIFQTLGDLYSQVDLDRFFSALAPEIPLGTHPRLNAVNGAEAPAPLDFQVSYPIIWPQNSILYQTDDPVYQNNYTFRGYFNNFLDAIDGSYCDPSEEELDPPYPNPAPGGYKGEKMCGVYEPTNVLSISYGGAESSLPIRYMRRQCLEYMKLGLQGVSVVFAAGNHGVATECCLGTDGKVFSPDFPATCPYITAVGATTVPPGGDDAHRPKEIAVRTFGSGGGFSNVFGRPGYQQSTVQKYLRKTDLDYPYYESIDNSSFAENGGIYNRIGRAYPDVSAIGDNILLFYRGKPLLGGGTSASAPIFGAILTRINEERLAAGMPTVGFVNPVLYAHPEAFRDVTEGSNAGCGTEGFPATKGWDPITGLGTPVYPKLLKVFMELETC
ncbi:peptidase S8/S53 domain-containing protein [Aspergillus pseudodeflectus]|uniref:tripeptidyl-peptidase II n=1 Tax=Aspergillus pseudodeflectus TaxID=176178 RepID=A0ABR4KP42_9EURO